MKERGGEPAFGTFTFVFAGVEIELLEESHVSDQWRVLNI